MVQLIDFSKFPETPFKSFVKGTARLEPTGEALRFINEAATDESYLNAQIDDYQQLARRDFLWRAPLHMRVQARFSHPDGQLKGTAGFGFWNDPFLMTGWRMPTLPRAVWFFYASPPSNMKLDVRTPGFGWKAATIDALRWPFITLLPFAPLAVPLMNNPSFYWLAWPLAQRAMQVRESLVPVSMTARHTYDLFWQSEQVRFVVDEQEILVTPTSPRGPLGFVMWLDNQYMVATPWGRFQYGLVANAEAQWMEVTELTIKPL